MGVFLDALPDHVKSQRDARLTGDLMGSGWPKRGQWGCQVRGSGAGSTRRVEIADLEARHSVTQFLSLIGHRLRRRRGLFDERSVLLGYLVHLRDRPVDLLDASALFLRC
jgi:hypothetical protein